MQKDKIITPMLKEIVSKGSGKLEGLDFRIKSEESLERKLKSKSKQKGIAVNEYANKVTDVLRYTNVSKEENLAKDYDIIVEELHRKGYNVVEVTNTFNIPSDYKGINTLIKDKEGYMFELQLHTPKSLEIKEINHKLYEEERLESTPRERKIQLKDMMWENASLIPTPKNIENIINKRQGEIS